MPGNASWVLALHQIARIGSCFPVVWSARALCSPSWFHRSMPPVEGRVTIISCSLGDGGGETVSPPESPVLDLQGFQMHIRQVLTSTGGRSYSLLPTAPMLGYKKSLLFVTPRSPPSRSNHRTYKHSDHAHETSQEMSRAPLYACLFLPLTSPCLCRAERRPGRTSPASPLPSSPSLSKFWGEEQATKIDGFPHRQQAQAWGSLCTALINDTCCRDHLLGSQADRKA